jgi:hypothetical protein
VHGGDIASTVTHSFSAHVVHTRCQFLDSWRTGPGGISGAWISTGPVRLCPMITRVRMVRMLLVSVIVAVLIVVAGVAYYLRPTGRHAARTALDRQAQTPAVDEESPMKEAASQMPGLLAGPNLISGYDVNDGLVLSNDSEGPALVRPYMRRTSSRDEPPPLAEEWTIVLGGPGWVGWFKAHKNERANKSTNADGVDDDGNPRSSKVDYCLSLHPVAPAGESGALMLAA